MAEMKHPFQCPYGIEYRGGDLSFPPITDEQIEQLVAQMGEQARTHPNRFRAILSDEAIANWRFSKKCVPLSDTEFHALREMVRRAEIPAKNPNEFTKEQDALAPMSLAFLCMLIGTIEELKKPKPAALELASSVVFKHRHVIDQEQQEKLTQAIATAFS